MSELLPLMVGFSPEAPFAWHAGAIVSQGRFLAQARHLAAQLPDAPQALNLCENHYRFMLTFAAVCLRGQTNLLPSSLNSATIAAVQADYPRSYVLDETLADAAIAAVRHDDREAALLPAAHVAAVLFTSGSTGAPQACAKRWHTMTVIARHLRERLLPHAPAHIVATVPAQHMYGLETTVLMALGAECVAHGGRPFFPQDVAEALRQLPAPRVLVTTPVHLRALVGSATELPELEFVLSATAPLSEALASACEAAWNAPVHEIYGCTEAGSMATRRRLDGERWQLLSEMELRCGASGVASVHAAHLPDVVLLQDVLELESPTRFRLLGRSGDLLKVAGRRASLAELTRQLSTIPGVQDAVVFKAGEGERARPAALVVAPALSAPAILDLLAQRVDAVFLPRPLRKVEHLPRNELGKLPRALLLELIGEADEP